MSEARSVSKRPLDDQGLGSHPTAGESPAPKPHTTPEWPDKPLTAHRVYQLVNGRQEDDRSVIDLMAALRSLEEQLRTEELNAEKWRSAAERMEAAYTDSVEQHEADAQAYRELNEMFDQAIDREKGLEEQLEALRGLLTRVTVNDVTIAEINQALGVSSPASRPKAEAYQRQAEAAQKAIDSSPGWIRDTAVPPPASRRDS